MPLGKICFNNCLGDLIQVTFRHRFYYVVGAFSLGINRMLGWPLFELLHKLYLGFFLTKKNIWL